MSLESTLSDWTGPSSDTEQDRQARTERMVREAVRNHVPLASCRLTIYAKGSYANNTNVRTDSDVDIAVQCHEAQYWEEATPGAHTPGAAYAGIWTPAKLRAEMGASLRSYFPGQVDDSGSTAIGVRSSSARLDADVVPCFDYRYYFASGASREGTRVFRKNGSHFENFPAQQLANGTRKNTRTYTIYKKSVRVLKRLENAMVANGIHRACRHSSLNPWCTTAWTPSSVGLRGPTEGALTNSVPQHGGAAGTDTRWISFPASDPPSWLAPFHLEETYMQPPRQSTASSRHWPAKGTSGWTTLVTGAAPRFLR